MKKFALLGIIVFTTATLIGCGKTELEKKTDEPVEIEAESLEESIPEAVTAEADGANEANQAENKEENGEDLEDVEEEEYCISEPKEISINLDQVEEMHCEGKAVEALPLSIYYQEENDVDFANEWYALKELSLPIGGENWNWFYDENYEYLREDGKLFISDAETGEDLYILSYPSDEWYVMGNNACLQDGIFYGVSILNGYAEPNSCYMFAYDIENEKLLWRSADQSCNTMNFIMKDDLIICGYGFTAEKDYIYEINKYTGEIIGKLELKKMPDLMAEKDGRLYVHTYSYNYVLSYE